MKTETERPACDYQMAIRVYWEDTDAGGVVFYANYLKFFERVRTDWLRDLGLSQETLRKLGKGMFVVSDLQMRYLRSARLDDQIVVTTLLVEQGRVSLVLKQQAWRQDELLAEGQVRIGWVCPAEPGANTATGAFKPGRIPEDILKLLPVRQS
ncbi:YbgC/FadM family acyl-CoA thioesterase [Aquabacterium sp.]|uniref:YbgC/FadM family acyl-CoA thioesterase n=1 Tax=Aquabacterium sp. TaxID=1872578 RepID=UPI0035ADF142